MFATCWVLGEGREKPFLEAGEKGLGLYITGALREKGVRGDLASYCRWTGKPVNFSGCLCGYEIPVDAFR